MANYTKHTIDVHAPLTVEQIKMLEKLKDVEPTPDEDCPELTDEQLREGARLARERRRKQTVSLRLSPVAIEKARSLGDGYTSILSRILEATLADNETLRRYL